MRVLGEEATAGARSGGGGCGCVGVGGGGGGCVGWGCGGGVWVCGVGGWAGGHREVGTGGVPLKGAPPLYCHGGGRCAQCVWVGGWGWGWGEGWGGGDRGGMEGRRGEVWRRGCASGRSASRAWWRRRCGCTRAPSRPPCCHGSPPSVACPSLHHSRGPHGGGSAGVTAEALPPSFLPHLVPPLPPPSQVRRRCAARRLPPCPPPPPHPTLPHPAPPLSPLPLLPPPRPHRNRAGGAQADGGACHSARGPQPGAHAHAGGAQVSMPCRVGRKRSRCRGGAMDAHACGMGIVGAEPPGCCPPCLVMRI